MALLRPPQRLSWADERKGIRNMEQELTRIFNRQFERCKAELKEANCPQVYIDSVSKYMTYLKIDIKEIMDNGNRVYKNT